MSEVPPLPPPHEDDAAAAPPWDTPLPPHRVALRALLQGCSGGLSMALVAVGALLLFESGSPSFLQLLGAIGLATVAGGTLAGLLTLAEETSLRVPRALRALVILLVGSGVTIVTAVAVVWVVAVFTGPNGGPEAGLRAVMRLFDQMGDNPDRFATISLVVLLPFGSVGACRVDALPGPPLGRPRPWWVQAPVAGATGLLGLLVVLIAYGESPNTRELPLVLSLFGLIPVAGALGLIPGRKLEERLLAWWVARQQD